MANTPWSRWKTPLAVYREMSAGKLAAPADKLNKVA